MNDHVDPFDELATMFLSNGDDARQAESGGSEGSSHDDALNDTMDDSAEHGTPATTTVLESLLVGHLPVRAGLWLTPYADAIARKLGPTVLIRLDRESPSIQLLRGTNGAWSAPPGTTLESAIDDLAPDVRAWIVYAGDAESFTPILRTSPDRITILSSADDVAVVKAYQLIKDVVASAENSQLSIPRMGVAVLGADPQRSQRVLDRINPTTSSFLGVNLDLVTILPQMDADIRSSCFLTFSNTPTPPVGDVMRWIAAAREELDSEPIESSAPLDDTIEMAADETDIEPDADEVSPFQFDDDDDFDDAHHVTSEEIEALYTPDLTLDELAPHDDAPEPEPVHAAPPRVEPPPTAPPAPVSAPPEPAVAAARHAAVTGSTVKISPSPVMEVEPKTGATVREPDTDGKPVPLASHINGLTPIAPRCPDHESVELALDAAGRLHLLTRVESLRELRVVERWVSRHHELLAMIAPTLDAPATARGQVELHVFTDAPRSVADLHATDLNLYVLAPVDVGHARGWYVAPLK